jgi:peptide/nickel transport system substrate-binding protein
MITLSAVAALVLAGCGAPPPSLGGKSGDPRGGLRDTTAAPVGDHGPITWANYRPTSTLDPIQSLDQPENTVLNALCEGLLMQKADGTIAPWLAQSVEYTTPTELTIKLRPGVTFWDGTAMTSADIAYSLERAKDPTSSYYAAALSSIQSVTAPSDNEVTITLATPDYWLRGYLATSAGIIIQKDYASQAGKSYGAAPGNVMCSGPYKLKSWQAGGDLTVEQNPDYWDAPNKAKVSEITFVAAPADADLTAGLTSGSINGTFAPVLGAYSQLKNSKGVSVTTGSGLNVDSLAIVNFKGVLGDLKVRQALSLAFDREAYINVAYPGGQAEVPRSSTNSATWRFKQDVFDSQLGDLKPMTTNINAAKKLIDAAGAKGKTIVMATTALPSVTAVTNAVVQAGAAIGLKVEVKNFAVAEYSSIFTDPAARAGLDVVDTLAGAYFSEPGTALAQFALPNAQFNLGGWDNSDVTDLLAKAQKTEDATQRASYEAQADKIVTQNLPLIPLAQQHNSVVMSREITGAPASGVGYMSSPWARMMGATGK